MLYLPISRTANKSSLECSRTTPTMSVWKNFARWRGTTEAGEPFLSLFIPKEIEALLREIGFADIMHFGPEEAVRTYFPGRTDVRFGGAQRLIVATVAANR